MKNMYLILLALFLFTGCSENENNRQENILNENATIYYDASEIDNCMYTIKTESNQFYTVENIEGPFRENNLRVNISFRKTDNTMNCGFSGNLTIIQIETIEKI